MVLASLLLLGGAAGAILFGGARPVSAQEAAARFTCPMHPHYVADEFGSCPICGMDLVPVEGGAESGAGEGYVSVDPEIVQTMGVVTAPAAVETFGRLVRAYGTVTANERTETVVASRVEGWIETLAVAAEGDAVEEGALLYRLFSPELVAAQTDYLAARRAGGARAASAEARLRSLGVQPRAIEALKTGGTPAEGVPVYAEADGIVADLAVREGSYLRPGDPIMVLRDYGTVWVEVAIEPQDLPDIDAGTPAEVTVSDIEGPIETVVDYVHPTVDPDTRTGEARLVLANESGRLMPGAYADVVLSVDAAPRLAVPSEAVLRDGRGAHVILALGEGRFAPRAVQTGVTALGLTAVRAGLVPGDQVVVSGQFLLDSEARLKEGFADFAPPPTVSAGPETPLSELPLDADALGGMAHLSDAALYLHEALVDGYPVEPSFFAPTLEMGDLLRARFAGTRLDPVVGRAQAALRAAQTAKDEAALRAALAALMEALEPWLLEGAPARYEAAGVTLYRTADGRAWLQEGEALANPYGEEGAVAVPWPDPMARADIDAPGPRAAPLEHDHR